MADPIDPRMLDKRVSQRYVKKGMLAEKDLERHLKALPDLADSASVVEATLESIAVGASGSHPDEE